MPNQSDGDLLHTMASYGLSHVRTKLRHLPVIPFLTPQLRWRGCTFRESVFCGGWNNAEFRDTTDLASRHAD